MELTSFISTALEIGMTPALLLMFAWYFLKRDKCRDKQIADLIETFKEREKIVLAEGTRREELMRQESERREKIILDSAERRESNLMKTIDGFSGSIEKISDTMDEIKKAFLQMEFRLRTVEENRKGGGS